ncbi:MAG TPA: mechanosensitive ion channel family protein [Nitrospiria bacterium]|nr:mechanosensitive ion channel family protein [Nitrospiria bacterium]
MKQFLEDWFFDPTFGRLIAAFAGVFIIFVLIRLVQRTLSRHVTDVDVRYRVRKLVGTLGYLFAVVFIAIVFSNRLGGLTVAFGVAGAGIAFALQEVIASIAGWAAISFGTFYKTGDRIQLGGITGDVIDIGILRTTLMECGQWVKSDLYNGRIVRVANSFVFKEAVFNYSADFPFLWDEIIVPVKYGCDRRLTREILERVVQEVVGDYVSFANSAWREIVAKYMIENAKTEPMVTLSANENWIEFTVRYVVDYKKRRSTKDLLFTRILEEFDKTDGRVAIASATLQLIGAGTAGVRGSDRK